MPVENRTRVEFYLPVRSDIASYQVTLDWLADELATSRAGATTTTPFAGLFSSAGRGALIHDAVRILFCDFELDVQNVEHRDELVEYLETTQILPIAEAGRGRYLGRFLPDFSRQFVVPAPQQEKYHDTDSRTAKTNNQNRASGPQIA